MISSQGFLEFLRILVINRSTNRTRRPTVSIYINNYFESIEIFDRSNNISRVRYRHRYGTVAGIIPRNFIYDPTGIVI